MMLCNALSAAAPPTRFACSGRLDKEPLPFLCPEVSVAGVGRLGLPLSIEQASTLKSVAEQAPHGKGLRTVVDTEVRDALQVDASRVSLGSSWQPVLRQAVAQVAEQLGLADSSTAVSVEARLYKLLLYEQGGHFSAHQDTEKERGMIGTLVVQLPCAQGHTGGSLTVRHRGKSHTHLAQGSERTLQYAAFFADCEHELSPIISGMRLVLVYNLVWAGPPGEAPRLYKRSPAEVQLARALHAWEAELAAGGSQGRMAILLEHQYTEANLGFEHLKGNDRAMARALSTCPGIDAHLVLVTRTVSGGAEYSGCGYKRRRWYDDDSESEEDHAGHHDMVEEYDRNEQYGSWIAVDGGEFGYDDVDLEEEYYDPDDNSLFDSDAEPDEEEYEGYTGNAGPTVDHIYRRALLVMWPRSQSLSYAQRAGLPAVLSVLKRRIADAEAQLKTSSKGKQQQAEAGRSKGFRRVAKHVLAALQACAQLLEQQQAQNASRSQQYTHSYNPATGVLGIKPVANRSAASTNEEVSTALQQGIRAVQLGVKSPGDVLLRLVASVANRQTGLTDTALVKQLGAAAALLDAAAVGPLLQQLVTRCMPGCPSGCMSLISCLKDAPELQQQVAAAAVSAAGMSADAVQPLLSLAVSLPEQSPVQQQVVDKLVTALKQDSSAAVASKVAGLLQQLQGMPQLQQQLASAAAASLIAAGPVKHLQSILSLLLSTQQQEGELRQQVVDAVCAALRSPGAATPMYQASTMLPALRWEPSLQQQLQAAMADGIFSSAGLLAAQTDGSMLQLFDVLVYSAGQLREKHFAAFAAAVAQRPNSTQLLLQLVQKHNWQPQELAMQQLIEAAIAAVRSTAASYTASSSSSGTAGLAGLQVSDWAQLLFALWQTPALQRQLRTAVTEAVCANSALMSAQSDASMLALWQQLLQDDQLQAAHFERFTAAVASRPSNTGLFLQLLQSPAVQQSAAALDCLVTAAADSIRNRGDSWQVVEVLQVASALDSTPEAQQRVHTAVAEAVFSNAPLLAAQTDDSMLQLSRIVLVDCALQDAHYAAFAAAVQRRQDGGLRLLQQLLQANAAAAAREQLVSAAADALRNRSSVWQISDATPLLTVLEAWPALQQQLKSAVADAMFTRPALLTSQTDSSILQLSQLLLESGSLQAAHFEQFAAAVTQRPNSTGLMALLLQSAPVAASAAAQEQLVAAAATAIRTRHSTWQVLEEERLLSALGSSAALRKRVESAVAEAVFTRASLLTAQTDASMLRLSSMLLGNPQLRAAYYDHFAAAVSQRRDSYQLLKQLLQSGPVTAALATPEVQQLVSCQVGNLKRLSAVPPFTWHMPQAVVPGGVVNSQQVQEFLRGPNQNFTLRGFTGIAQARTATQALLGTRYPSYGRPTTSVSTTYSINADARGTGRNAYVNITKTNVWYNSQIGGKEVYRRELQAVKALRR